MLTVERVIYRYDEGYYSAIIGEPSSVCETDAARRGYRDACRAIADWRKSGLPEMPFWIDPQFAKTMLG